MARINHAIWYSIIFMLFIITIPAYAAKRTHPEKLYQQTWCDEMEGQTEYRLDDATRVDCLLDDYAIEFDYADKWAEGIGQALYYGIKTNRAAGVVLIMEKGDNDQKYYQRLDEVASKHGIVVWKMGVKDLRKED